jgi:hypothetical protein
MIRTLSSWIALATPIYATLCLRAEGQPAPPSAAPEVHISAQLPAQASDDASALAEKLQNPIANLISFPFQNNTNFNVGPNTGTQHSLNIQPVIPIHDGWTWGIGPAVVAVRTTLPWVYGLLVNTVFSQGGTSGPSGTRYNFWPL